MAKKKSTSMDFPPAEAIETTAPPQTSTGRVNKSEAIRQYALEHPGAKAKEIVEALGRAGIEVAPSNVFPVLQRLKKGEGTREFKARASRNIAKATASINGEGLSQAAEFAIEVGGLDRAQSLLDQLRRIKQSL